MTDPLTYAGAGVDIAAGNQLVARIKAAVARTARPGADAAIGGFGGVFDLAAAGHRDPILVAATDGVGTKLDLAVATGRHETIGTDLVAMCVNDLVVQGAEPLFFLDYFATGHLALEVAEQVVVGIAEACRQVNMALLGGETAEMPGLYEAGRYDLAGFAIGAVARDKLLPRQDIVAGDRLIGLMSSGLHSNGFSLVRAVVERHGLDWRMAAPFDGRYSLGEALLTPTRLYVTAALAAHTRGLVKAYAHITGGGLLENVPRVLPDSLTAEIHADAWDLPGVFRWLADTGPIAADEMARAFNCGIGFVAVVAEADVPAALDAFADAGETATVIGHLVPEVDALAVRLSADQWPGGAFSAVHKRG